MSRPIEEIGETWEPNLSDCPYYQYQKYRKGDRDAMCNRGCWQEPLCMDEGWLDYENC